MRRLNSFIECLEKYGKYVQYVNSFEDRFICILCTSVHL